MIEIKNINKSYGSKKVVDNVSFNIEEGKITSFIGPNGAGKSTVLSIISRLLDADSGEVFIDGKEIKAWDSKELSKKLSILKQNNNLSIRLTIRELVSFGRFPYCEGKLKKEDEKFIEDALSYMKLTDIQDKYIDELSGGQRQRAYIAMILAQDTDYILLDEPLNNLDMKHSAEMMRMLRQMVNDFGKTIVIVIHDINFASCYSDTIVALKDGKLVNHTSTEEMITENNLKRLYDMNFNIKEVDNQKICIYF